MYGWIAAHKMLHCSKTAWNVPKLGAGRMNESSSLVCIPLLSPFLFCIGEQGGQAALGSWSVLESHEADKRRLGALLALAWQSTWSTLAVPGDRLHWATGATLCAASLKRLIFARSGFSIG